MQIDNVFTHAQVFNVFTKTWATTDIAVAQGRILYVGDVSGLDRDLSAVTTIDCGGRPVIPGMIDIHLHIESSLCTPQVFANAVLKHGVTTVVAEPHEIANVFGVAGIRELIRLAAGSAIEIFFAVPSSVPSTNPELETNGGRIGVLELEELMAEPSVVCLGEVMNFGELIDDRPCGARSLIKTMKEQFAHAAIEGHVPSIRGYELAKVMYEGVDSDHCLQDLDGLKERFQNGMFVELQEKSILPDIMTHLTNTDSDGLYCLVTDDVPPDVLATRGHLDAVVRTALRNGLPLEKAIVATSRSPAARVGLRNRGAVSPGNVADFVILEDRSEAFEIHAVYRAGIHEREVHSARALAVDPAFTNSLKLNISDISDDVFRVPAPAGDPPTVLCRAIRKNTATTYTEYDEITLPVVAGSVQWEDHEANLVLVMDRYTGTAGRSQALLTGPETLSGAFASTHSHDHHNLMVVGSNAADMQKAADWVVSHSGGICVVANGEIRASLALPVGGILSDSNMDTLSDTFIRIQRSLRELGISHHNPFMSLTTLTLPVSPAVKVTDKGIVDVRSGTIADLFIEG